MRKDVVNINVSESLEDQRHRIYCLQDKFPCSECAEKNGCHEMFVKDCKFVKQIFKKTGFHWTDSDTAYILLDGGQTVTQMKQIIDNARAQCMVRTK